MKALLVLLLTALVVPALARAEPATIVSRDVALSGSRTLSASAPRFTLVGLHWKGGGDVRFRTRGVAGGWSRWRPAAPEDEDRPDPLARESSRSREGWRIGNPYWTGPSDALEIRTIGRVTRVRAHYVWSAPEPRPARTLSMAGSPAIVPRLSWGANEMLKRAPPTYTPDLAFAVVHHTAGSNTYTRAQAPAIVKAIQIYHVQGNGWNDIGYNFLVDKYGQVYEGRYGGVERNVVGAHAEGFNTGSTGVAVLGNYSPASLPAAARAAIVQLVSWRLDIAHLDPLATFNWLSGGNPRFPRGVPVFLRTIVGHRDTGFTECPGDRLYAQLDSLAQAVSTAGLPKLYAPTVSGGLGSLVRFSGRVSGVVPWTVTVSDAAGRVVAEQTGLGPTIDWSWDASAAPPGSYAWTIGGGGIRPARGTLRSSATALALTHLVADPSSLTPNDDGVDDDAVISYRLSLPATVTAKLHDSAGTEIATLFSEPRPAGEQSFTFAPEALPDGTYRIVLTAVGVRGKVVTASVDVLINRTLSGVAASRGAFSPNGDGRADVLSFAFTLAAPAEVKLRILRGEAWVATLLAGPLGPGRQAFSWDGAKRLGRVRDGAYSAELSVTDVAGTITQRIPFVVDSTPPRVEVVGMRPLRLRVDEPASIVVLADGRREVIQAPRAGVFAAVGALAPKRVRAVAWDAAGNVSVPATARVKARVRR
jgi:N-acetylmuramoyl-L-alanine amidase